MFKTDSPSRVCTHRKVYKHFLWHLKQPNQNSHAGESGEHSIISTFWKASPTLIKQIISLQSWRKGAWYIVSKIRLFFPYNPSVFPNSLEWICFGSSSKFYELVWSIFLNNICRRGLWFAFPKGPVCNNR